MNILKRIAHGLDGYLSSPRFISMVPCWPAQKKPSSGEMVRNILVIRLDEIGDIVLTSPFFRELRRLYPDAKITAVVKPAVHNLLERCPYLDQIITFSLPPPRSMTYTRWQWYCRAFAIQKLRKPQFDLVILPRFDFDKYRASSLAFFSAGTRRVAYSERATDLKQTENQGADQYFTEVLPSDDQVLHEVERNLNVIRFLGGSVLDQNLELWIDDADRTAAGEHLKGLGNDVRKLIAFGVGGGFGRKIWPAERFAEVAARLNAEGEFAFVVVGGPDDKKAAETIVKSIPNAIDLTGRTTLRQTAAVFERCSLYIGDDTGPMHMAAAMQKAVVEISCHPRNAPEPNMNSVIRFGPWGVPTIVVRPKNATPPCKDSCELFVPHCILSVSVDAVVQAAGKLLQAV